MAPNWLQILGAVSLLVAAGCAGAMVVDILRGHRQHMWIMNVVWPVTALWAGPLGLWAYFRIGRPGGGIAAGPRPFRESVGLADTHCGAGCTLGDICAEWVHAAVPFTIGGVAMFGAWALDFVFAFVLGIVFQYFTITPMRQLSPGEGLIEALKADTLSLTAWQVGMYGWMAIMHFAVFRRELPPTEPAFWFLMQIAMAAGFLTSYPVNWFLVSKGIKEKM